MDFKKGYRKNEQYMSRINDITEQSCKSKQEWQDEEIYHSNSKFYITQPKTVEELKDKNQLKLYHYQKTEDNLLNKIEQTEKRISELSVQISILQEQHFPRKLKRKQNKFEWAKKRLFEYQNQLYINQKKQRRYEYLFNKWNGILQKIILADTTNQISKEKSGNIAPYYGFNDNREMSNFIHEDKK